MFYDNELRFLQKMLEKSHIQSLLIDPEAVVDEQVDNHLGHLFMHPQRNRCFYDYFPQIKGETVYRMADLFFCRYVFFLLPFCERPQVFFVGPYLNTTLSQQQIWERGERVGISPKMIGELEAYYASLPVVRDETLLYGMINTFAEYIWSGEDRFETVDIDNERSAAFLSGVMEPKAPSENGTLRMHVMEHRYNYENELMEAVAQGNAHKAERMMGAFSAQVLENRVADPLRNAKNYCVIMNTLMRKAAEKGGVHPVHLDRVSSDFARRIEALHNVSVVMEFMMEIMRTYCRLVKRYSIKQYSPLIQKVIIKVENDLTCDLSLQTMAQQNSVSAGYLSGLFKRETGQTFTSYVNSRRVHLAKHLLKTTSLQVQTIAQHCGILDFHYFCRVFKNCTGKTPTEYRSSYVFE